MFLAVSTPASTRQVLENHRQYGRNEVITVPNWFFFDVYFFEGMVPFSFAGIHHTMHQGQYVDTFAGLADRFVGGNWRNTYGPCTAGPYRTGMRMLLMRMGVQNWLELTCGYSWEGYRALDFYVRMHSTVLPAPEFEAWYVLNDDVPPCERQEPDPQNWWKYDRHRCVGQKFVVDEWCLLADHGALMVPPFAPPGARPQTGPQPRM